MSYYVDDHDALDNDDDNDTGCTYTLLNFMMFSHCPKL